jgi:cytosine/adenosine deaminase-related metal-dependent hydrolase
MSAAIDEACASGTGLVGDISNTLRSAGPLEAGPLHARVFREVIGFRAGEPHVMKAVREIEARPETRVRFSLAAHAPYSVAPDVIAALAGAGGDYARRPRSIHLGESPDEIEFLATGCGAFRVLLEELGAWDPAWTCPRCGPVEYLDRLGFLDDRTLVVHGVHLADAELRVLAARGATLVTCPRSNEWTGGGAPPVERFYRSGVRVAVGTDSLASVADLNLLAELAALRRHAPGIAAAALLESATAIGARALGFGGELGTIEPGCRAALVAARIPPGEPDVEEYLVSGRVSAEPLGPQPAGSLERRRADI